MTNLLSNAFKYTRSGGRVILRARPMEGRVVIEVEYECGGLPEGKSDVFTPFGERRAKNRTGLGLGLSIAQEILTRHQGTLRVVSQPGVGSTFTIRLPGA